MSALPEREGVDRVFFELSRHPEWLWQREPAARVPEGLAEELLSMSNDIATTVWLLLVWQEEYVAVDFLNSVDVKAVANEYQGPAGNEQNARERLAEEVDGLIEAAGMYGERISNLMENGVIVGNEQVKAYCAEKLERMLSAWIEYRERLQNVVGAW